jgi:type II secretory pathway pseudopilin PulG
MARRGYAIMVSAKKAAPGVGGYNPESSGSLAVGAHAGRVEPGVSAAVDAHVGRVEPGGFSRYEVCFVLAILLAIISLAIPAWLDARQRQRVRKTYSEMRMLVSAATQYNLEYRLWPVDHEIAATHRDVRYGLSRPNARVMHMLQGVDGPGNRAHQANALQIDFIAMVSRPGDFLRYNAAGEAIDPWGRPYHIAVDANYDGITTIEESSYDAVIGDGVLVWSNGPDGKAETGDDLKSWIR